MRLIPRFRVSIATMMMFVVAAAAGAALFAKIRAHADTPTIAGLKTDAPMLLLLAIGLTTIALGSWKAHSAVQMCLQGTIACLGCLSLIWISEAQLERTTRYWFQAAFAASVVAPMMVRRYVKTEMPKGPRREWWKKTCEAVFFSFLGVLLVSAGVVLQLVVSMAAFEFFRVVK